MDSHNETNNGAGKESFWRRQFSSTITTPQLTYDVLFGILLPILCFIFDPAIFTNDGFGLVIFSIAQYKWFVYLFSALSIISLSVWLLAYRAGTSAGGIVAGLVAGILLAGAAASFVIGCIILPLSLIGLMVLIGVLGFTPFFTAFVYLRNGVRALKLAESNARQPTLVGSLLSGALLVIALSYVAHTGLNRMVAQAVNDLTKDDPQVVDAAVRRLKWVGWSVDMDHLVWAYSKEQDQTRKQNLARAYKEITGNDINHRLAVLLD
jgi:hypothetical protein